MDAGEIDTWQWPVSIIKTFISTVIHRITNSSHYTGIHWTHKFNPQTLGTGLHVIPISMESESAQRAPAPTILRPTLTPYCLGHGRCSPSCHCPDGRCLPARTGGYSRARSPHGCRYRQSRASTPGSRTRKSTALGGRRRPGAAAQEARRVVRWAGCPGLRTPASWCRAQTRARAASWTVLQGRSPGRVRKDERTRTPGLARLGRSSCEASSKDLYKRSGWLAQLAAAGCRGDWGGANSLLANYLRILLPS